ncbi:hypothetical protein AB3331_02040 [Streptococcus sp. H49]|uniref:hypothetical protein n=1 Tax=Streptococcus huangxiaojuni TaxID=3237239 RepID=UPI0034A27648
MLEQLAKLGTVDLSKLQEAYTEALKAQERLVIKAAIAVQKQKIRAEKQRLKKELQQEKTDLKTYLSASLPADLGAGFEGKAAAAAQDFLSGFPQPQLPNPIILE